MTDIHAFELFEGVNLAESYANRLVSHLKRIQK